MFAGDTNLFYTEESIETLFDTVNIEFQKISHGLTSIKLSLNKTRTEH